MSRLAVVIFDPGTSMDRSTLSLRAERSILYPRPQSLATIEESLPRHRTLSGSIMFTLPERVENQDEKVRSPSTNDLSDACARSINLLQTAGTLSNANT